jgi:hypothetical protein
MLLCLANIGDVLAEIFRFIYSKICCCGCCKSKKKHQEKEQKKAAAAAAAAGDDHSWNAGVY